VVAPACFDGVYAGHRHPRLRDVSRFGLGAGHLWCYGEVVRRSLGLLLVPPMPWSIDRGVRIAWNACQSACVCVQNRLSWALEFSLSFSQSVVRSVSTGAGVVSFDPDPDLLGVEF
jgi:hypothetical protein